MKNFFTKNATLAVTLFIGGSTFTYVAVTEFHAYKKRNHIAVEKAQQKKASVGASEPFIKNDDKLQACYENFLKKGSLLDEGYVRYHITITKKGDIDQLQMMENQFNDEEFSDCLTNEIKTRKVAATPERLNVVINHKFNFKRRTPAQISYEH